MSLLCKQLKKFLLLSYSQIFPQVRYFPSLMSFRDNPDSFFYYYLFSPKLQLLKAAKESDPSCPEAVNVKLHITCYLFLLSLESGELQKNTQIV